MASSRHSAAPPARAVTGIDPLSGDVIGDVSARNRPMADPSNGLKVAKRMLRRLTSTFDGLLAFLLMVLLFRA